MRPGDIVEAKSFALQLWEMEKQFMRIAPSSKDRYLLKELVRLEDKPVEHRTEGEQWEIEQINEKLAEKRPYAKQTRPPLTNAIQPVRTPRSFEERALQMEPHVRASLKGLNDHLLSWGVTPQTTFTMVDGAAATAARFPKPVPQVKPNPFVRFGRWVKSIFKPHRRQPAEMELLELELAHALIQAEKNNPKE